MGTNIYKLCTKYCNSNKMYVKYAYIMSTNDDKYLVLRGKNKDIYFIQKRVSKDISRIIGKDFIKKSLETKNIHIARQKRDQILEELEKTAVNNSIKLENEIELVNSNDIYNVPIRNKPKNDSILDNFEHKIVSNKKKYNIFSLELLKRENLVVNVDKYIPIGIVILTLFVAFVA